MVLYIDVDNGGKLVQLAITDEVVCGLQSRDYSGEQETLWDAYDFDTLVGHIGQQWALHLIETYKKYSADEIDWDKEAALRGVHSGKMLETMSKWMKASAGDPDSLAQRVVDDLPHTDFSDADATAIYDAVHSLASCFVRAKADGTLYYN